MVFGGDVSQALGNASLSVMTSNDSAKRLFDKFGIESWEPFVAHDSRIEIDDGVVHGVHGVLVLRDEGLVQTAEGVQFETRGHLTLGKLPHHRRLGGFEFGGSVCKISEGHEAL